MTRWYGIEEVVDEIRRATMRNVDMEARFRRREIALKAALWSDCGPLDLRQVESWSEILEDIE